MTACSEAEELAQSLDDQYSLGLIYRTMAHISNATYGFSDEIRYLNLSSGAFKSADKPYNGVDKELDSEAVRVVGSSPKWEPGRQRDRAVPVTYTFPVVFQLR